MQRIKIQLCEGVHVAAFLQKENNLKVLTFINYCKDHFLLCCDPLLHTVITEPVSGSALYLKPLDNTFSKSPQLLLSPSYIQ